MRPFMDVFSSPEVRGKHLSGWIVRRFGPNGFEAQAFTESKPAHDLYKRWLKEYEEAADDGFGPLEQELNAYIAGCCRQFGAMPGEDKETT